MSIYVPRRNSLWDRIVTGIGFTLAGIAACVLSFAVLAFCVILSAAPICLALYVAKLLFFS